MKISSFTLSPPVVWGFLVLATGLTFAAGESGAAGRGLIVLTLLLAVAKGSLVILEFMELRQAPALWRRLVLGWLLVVASGIVFTYLKGTP